MTARIRTSTFLGAVNQLVTATTRLSESAQGNKSNPGKAGITGRADLECGLGHSFISGVVGCKKWLWAWATGHGHNDQRRRRVTGLRNNTHPTANSITLPTTVRISQNATPFRPTAQSGHLNRLFERRSGFQDACRITRFLSRALEAAR